jgi:hypothetical protein
LKVYSKAAPVTYADHEGLPLAGLQSFDNRLQRGGRLFGVSCGAD